ncbi:hypothetical protein ACQ4PT_009604 [Festuca glaucescens]
MDLQATSKAPRKRNTTSETTRSNRVLWRRTTANSTRFRRSNLLEIPEDLVLEILVRLPVKSLLRFKTVCKAWHVTISSQSFIAAHLQRSASNHKRRLSFLITPYLSQDLWPNTFSNNIRFYEWHHDGGGEADNANADLVYAKDFRGRFRSVYRLAHCHGLVLLPTDNKLYILNPARRELLTLPESIGRVHDPSSFCRGSVGFGHDPSTNRYKGSLFWLLRERDRLLRFCLRAETFSFTVHPPCPPGLDLSELDGELCLAHHESSHGVLTIWMTKDGVNPQWHRRYVLNVESCFTMAISPYGLLLKKHDYTIVQYNFRNNKLDDVASLEDLRYQGLPGTYTVEYNKGENLFFIEMIPYTQSLVSLTNAK